MSVPWFPRKRRVRRPGLTLIELLLSIAGLGVLGCLMLSYGTPAQAPEISAVTVSEPAPPPPPGCPIQRGWGELSLQETLDRLGYTVNVPHEFQGQQVAANGYRVSTADDSIAAGRFTGNGAVEFQVVSQQSALAGCARLLAKGDDKQTVTLMDSGFASSNRRSQIGPGRSFTSGFDSTVQLSLAFSEGNGFNAGTVSSVAADNPGGSAQLIVLPARKGGVWVDEGDRTGHWEGGEDTGKYLLCWEDLTGPSDRDYQDLVLLAGGLEPRRD